MDRETREKLDKLLNEDKIDKKTYDEILSRFTEKEDGEGNGEDNKESENNSANGGADENHKENKNDEDNDVKLLNNEINIDEYNKNSDNIKKEYEWFI